MVTTVGGFIIFIICLVGCGLHAYFLGRRVGVEEAVNYLADNGHIDVDD